MTPKEKEKQRKQKAWMDWLNKIDKEMEGPVFQMIFNPVCSGDELDAQVEGFEVEISR